MNDELVQIDRSQKGVAVVSMRRADKRNALNIALLQQMRDAIEKLEQNATCRVVILRGEGPAFCAGLDLIEATRPEVAEESAEGVRRILSLLRESPLVVIAAAHGAAYAGGAGLLAACDLVVAADDLKIAFPEVRRGLVAAMVWGVLTRKIRGGDLRELLLLGEPITAARALQMGLVQWLTPSEQVLEQSRNIAKKILAGGPESIRETKHLLNTDPGSVDFDFLKALHERIRHGTEAREGLAAFSERREPSWCNNN
jgi:enoyl-CoA hydratase/carnithine racemase